MTDSKRAPYTATATLAFHVNARPKAKITVSGTGQTGNRDGAVVILRRALVDRSGGGRAPVHLDAFQLFNQSFDDVSTSKLAKSLERYLALRRGLGAKLRDPGAYLRRFVEFLDHEDSVFITTQLALRWATSPTSATSATWARRLADVRRFAAWMSTMDPRTEVPPHGLLPDRYRRRTPYI